ncbi:MAG: MFS transporter [Candidatus Brocadiia bacterium]|nr:MFS transporter [Candidatus Brocadiia bacterium]
MGTAEDQTLKAQVREARSKFISMAVCYSLGVFNDNFFRQAAMLLAVGALKSGFQGTSMVLFSLPYLLLAAPAGWLADRFSKRHIVVGAKGLELVAMSVGAFAICTTNWPLMLAVVCLMGVQSAIFNPSLNGSIPELYPASYVTGANAKMKVATTGAVFLGFALAAFAFALEGDDTPVDQVSRGKVAVGVAAITISLIGLLASFGVPRRAAAAPHKRFPWAGPANTLAELWRIRKDRLLFVTLVTNAFIWFLGAVELLIINQMGLHQFGLSKPRTGTLLLTQLVGVAAGGLLSSRLARGKRWYRILAPSALGFVIVMLGVTLAPLLPGPWALVVVFPLLGAAGLFGGMMLVPTAAFIQLRPESGRKGAVLAASNFAAFTGIMLAGPLEYALIGHFTPARATSCFAALGALTLLVAVALVVDLPRTGPGNLLDSALVWVLNRVLRRRYRIAVSGLDEVAERGTRGILFLPNHPALIDPIIMSATLQGRFAPRAWADEDQIDRPFIRTLARRFGVRAVPRVRRQAEGDAGGGSRQAVRRAVDACIEDLAAGRCVLLYPSGHVYRKHLEDLRGNSAAHTIIRSLPDVRVVLARTTGLWGSGFSWAGGHVPEVGGTLKKGLIWALLSGIFFAPRRRVTIEFYEPDDLPLDAGPDALNRFMEEFFNRDAPPNTYVPYSAWEGGGARRMPEPFIGAEAGDVSRVPTATRQIVLEHLQELTGVASIRDDHHLARDLGMDSLSRAELIGWLESEFGFPAGDHESVQSVADALLAACGESVQGEPEELKAIAPKWFRDAETSGRLLPPEGETVTGAFLRAARRSPGRAIIADQAAGVRTYRDLITAIFLLRPEVAALAGERVGIMMPASVAADMLYLATLFAGKTPGMVNWTVGVRNVVHSLDLVGVSSVLTARALVTRLAGQGTDLGALKDRFVYLEDVRARFSFAGKLGAWLRAHGGWASLSRADVPETAAVLFTSGSESLPKAVPLTHRNLLTNAGDLCRHASLRLDDRAIGILPPFHSFGLTVTVILPLCTGMQAVYHPSPTEGGMLARLIEAYKVSLVLGTPTFLNGILRASTDEQLSTLRLAVTGAEKCPDRVYEALARRCPQTTVLEGYGVTECSPVVCANTDDDPRAGTIGRMLPSVEHVIVNVDTGQRVQPGESGMLLVRGPSVFGGYLNYDGESPFVDFEGRDWYRTGDLVSEDADGVLTFRGRLKRFTKLGGEMISLPAIEAALQVPVGPVLERHYAGDDDEGPVIAVEVTPDEDHPEIVLFTTMDIDRETVNRRIREAGLSGLHNIRRVIRLDEIPLLGTGKTDYRTLKARLQGETP